MSRCSDGTYWAHIGRNSEDGHLVVMESRIDYTDRVEEFPDETLTHVAVRVGRHRKG